jgi:hypothetical protein
MHESSIRVMNMVRRALLETPDVSDRALYEAAVALEATIGELSLKQFQARYPRRVRRLEIGPPKRRSNARGEPPTELSIGERPHVYAPGEDTLRREPGPTSGQSDSSPGPMPGEHAGGTPRTSRRVQLHARGEDSRLAGAAGSGEAVEHTSPVSRVGHDPEVEPHAGEADAAGSPSSSPAQPWPLMLKPAATDGGPNPRLRLLPKSSVGKRKARRSIQADGRVPAGQPASQPASRASKRDRAASSQDGPRKTESVHAGQESPASRRVEIRRILLTWARDIAAAESRGSLVAAVARADELVNVIVDRYLMRSGDGVPAGESSAAGPRSLDGPSSAPPSGPPEIRAVGRIDAHDPAELDAIVRWVAEAGEWHDEEELTERVFGVLGFRRRGRRILATIRAAVDRVLGGDPTRARIVEATGSHNH